MLGAADTFRVEHGRWPNSMEEMVTLKYLKEVPSIEAQVASAEGRANLVSEAHAANAKEVWTMPSAGRPTFVLSNAVSVSVCRNVNEKSRGDDGILKKPHTTLTSQCFGSADTALTVVVTKDPADLGTALAPIVVRAAGVPTDTSSLEWHRIPVKAMSAEPPAEPPAGAPVSLVTGSLAGAVVGVPYSGNLNNFLTVDGKGYSGSGVTWSVVSGVLPDGLFLTSDGFISGTPTFEGAGDITVRAGYGTSSSEQTFHVAATPLTLSFSTGAPPAAVVGQPYTYDFKSVIASNDSSFSGEKASFSATGLPNWLSLSDTGVLSGTPSVVSSGGSSFEVVASYMGKEGKRVYSLVVNGEVLRVSQLSGVSGHMCAVTLSGGLKCWGNNTYGQLGNNSTTDSAVPVDVVGLTSGVVSVSASSGFTCVLLTSGGVKCWGANQSSLNDQGYLGDGTITHRMAPVDVVGLQSGVASISGNNQNTCAVLVSGGVKCWGAHYHGQLGDGTGVQTWVPVDVVGLQGATSVAVGYMHACAILNTKAVKCWGNAASGQLGNGTSSTMGSLVPVDVGWLPSGAVSLSLGRTHSCAVTPEGGAKCWGHNQEGQLGNGTTVRAVWPTDVTGLTSGVKSISAGAYHTCALTTAGGVKCWGYNYYGQMGGSVSATAIKVPVDVAGLTSGVTGIRAAAEFTCAVMANDTVKCLGQNKFGQLGNNVSPVLEPADLTP